MRELNIGQNKVDCVGQTHRRLSMGVTFMTLGLFDCHFKAVLLASMSIGGKNLK